MTDREGPTAPSDPKGIDGRDPLVGHVLAKRFKLLDLIARGGMGKIYRAEQMPLGRLVAVKVLAPAERQAEEEVSFRRRFEREASICARLSHSNTVRVFDYGWTDDGIYYIAMEYIEGRTLQHLLKAEAPIAASRTVHMMRQLCGSLSEAHRLGIIHRDLKPGNVILTTQGDDRDFVKVVDFGLVKQTGDHDITQAGLIVGSPMYMSPEQVRGEELDQRADIYAMGMMAYVCLTGRRPFDRDTPIAIMMARTTKAPPPMREINPEVAVPASLEWVVMTCMAMDPSDRFATMTEVLRALRVCDAEIRGDPNATSFLMSLEDGKVTLPVDFSDPSMVSRVRTGPLPLPPRESRPYSGSQKAAAAGLSLVALATLAFGAVIVVGLVVAAWIASRPTALVPAIAPVARHAAPASPPAPDAPPAIEEAPVDLPTEAVGKDAATMPLVTQEPAPTPVDTPARAPTPKPKPSPKAVPSGAAAEAVPPPPPTPPQESAEWKVHSEVRNPFQR